MTTEWEKKIHIKYKELFENYKNIEMFQNIYTISGERKEDIVEDIVEGFNIFGDDFNMDAKRNRNRFNAVFGETFVEIIELIKDFILCPFYSSDQIIDNGIQKLLRVFLAVECNDLKLFKENKDEKMETVDISNDLINPKLLYKSDDKEFFFEQFENRTVQEGMKNDINSIKRRKKARKRRGDRAYDTAVDCGNAQKQAEREIKRHAGTIRNEIYNIIFLPIILHMFYNCYYMFFHKNAQGIKPEFIDIEEKFYIPSIKPYFGFYLDFAIKPVSLLYTFFNFIANPGDKEKGYSFFQPLQNWFENYPYLMFILLFIIMYSIISQYNKNILSMWGGLLLGTSVNPFTIFAIIVMAIMFFFDTKEGLLSDPISEERTEDIKVAPISGSIRHLTYWIIRLVVNIFIYPIAAYLCTFYVFIYLFFGASISDNKDPFEVFQDIDDSILKIMYKSFDDKCGNSNWWGFIVKYFFRFIFIFFIEVILYYLLLNSTNVFILKISNHNILSFLLIFILSLNFILGTWCFMKFLTTVPKINSKYEVA